MSINRRTVLGGAAAAVAAGGLVEAFRPMGQAKPQGSLRLSGSPTTPPTVNPDSSYPNVHLPLDVRIKRGKISPELNSIFEQAAGQVSGLPASMLAAFSLLETNLGRPPKNATNPNLSPIMGIQFEYLNVWETEFHTRPRGSRSTAMSEVSAVAHYLEKAIPDESERSNPYVVLAAFGIDPGRVGPRLIDFASQLTGMRLDGQTQLVSAHGLGD